MLTIVTWQSAQNSAGIQTLLEVRPLSSDSLAAHLAYSDYRPRKTPPRSSRSV